MSVSRIKITVRILGKSLAFQRENLRRVARDRTAPSACVVRGVRFRSRRRRVAGLAQRRSNQGRVWPKNGKWSVRFLLYVHPKNEGAGCLGDSCSSTTLQKKMYYGVLYDSHTLCFTSRRGVHPRSWSCIRNKIQGLFCRRTHQTTLSSQRRQRATGSCSLERHSNQQRSLQRSFCVVESSIVPSVQSCRFEKYESTPFR